MFCTKCGKQIKEGASFCTACGAKVKPIAQPQVAQPEPQVAQPEPQVQPAVSVNVPDMQAQPAEVPAAPKKGLPKGAKIAIIIAAAVTGLLLILVAAGIAVFFLVVKPKMEQPADVEDDIITVYDDTTAKPDVSELPPLDNAEPAIQVSDEEVDEYVNGIYEKGIKYLSRPSILNDNLSSKYSSVIPASRLFSFANDFSDIDNADLIEYYNDKAKEMLAENQFLVMDGYYDEFFSVYESNRYAMTPNFVTVDSIMHTYHLYFAYLMKNTEKNELIGEVSGIGSLMKAKSEEQYNALKGTEWEKAAWTNLAFFTVGDVILNPGASIPADVADAVQAELSLIEAADRIEVSPLFNNPDYMEDYSQYKPRGYYDTDEELSKYFKAMMWYGRRNFASKDEDQNRSALLMTLAMEGDVLAEWERVYTVTSFFAGSSDDCGYYEFRPIIDATYGENVTVSDLPGDEKNWKAFHKLVGMLPAPRINSVVVMASDSEDEKEAKINGFRFMGQRFSIDEAIFSNLCYDKTDANSQGQCRYLPNALDVPAALGSDTALDILEEKGETDYAGYDENMESLRRMVKESTDSLWNNSLYSGWVNTLRPVLEEKGDGYPEFMQSEEWNKKNLTTFLGSYAELKHDTILYSKQMIAEMGDGEIPVRDDRGYVEPEPEVYARLYNLVNATMEGLDYYGVLRAEDKQNLELMSGIVEKLQVIAEKELTDELPTEEEFEFIRTYGGQLEHFWQEVHKDEAENEYFTTREFPCAIIADVATDPNGSCLELATGYANMIVVVVEVDGVKKLAFGSVYSFYQFDQPLSDRMTDTQWRQLLGMEMMDDGNYNYMREGVPPQEDWTKSYRYGYEED